MPVMPDCHGIEKSQPGSELGASISGLRFSKAGASSRGFTVRHLKEGSLPTYQLAFLMADYLITRDGFDRTVDTHILRVRRIDTHKIYVGMRGGVGKDEFDVCAFFGESFTELVASYS